MSVWSQVHSCREVYTNILWAGKRGSCPQQPVHRSGSCCRVTGEDKRGGVSRGGGVVGGGIVNRGGCVGDVSGGGRDGVVQNGGGCETPQAGAGTESASSRRTRERLPPRLWPACGIRSLVIWRRPWEGRGLQVRVENDRLSPRSFVLPVYIYVQPSTFHRTNDWFRFQIVCNRDDAGFVLHKHPSLSCLSFQLDTIALGFWSPR